MDFDTERRVFILIDLDRGILGYPRYVYELPPSAAVEILGRLAAAQEKLDAIADMSNVPEVYRDQAERAHQEKSQGVAEIAALVSLHGEIVITDYDIAGLLGNTEAE